MVACNKKVFDHVYALGEKHKKKIKNLEECYSCLKKNLLKKV